MKRLLASPTGALAAAMAVLAGSMLIGPAAMADSNDRGRHERSWNDRKDHRQSANRHSDRRHDDRDRHDHRHAQHDRRSYDRHYRDYRYSGRYSGPRYRVVHYHPPRGYRPHVWYRGAHLPAAYYAPRYVVHNYGDYHLHRPPHGYHWVRVDNDVILAAITTGIVLQVVNDIFY